MSAEADFQLNHKILDNKGNNENTLKSVNKGKLVTYTYTQPPSESG